MRQKHLVLDILPIRVVFNNSNIFLLDKKEPLVINCTLSENLLFITNGFQSSKKLRLKYKAGSNYFFQVNAVVENAGVYTAIGISLAMFAAYIFTGIKLLMIIANVPILVLLYIFFIKPGRSILIKNWVPSSGKN